MVNQEHITDVVKPYDWTYSTRNTGSNVSPNQDLEFEPTTVETIDIEQLKRPDPILFYDENILFEDELADNGTALLTTKMVKKKTIQLILFSAITLKVGTSEQDDGLRHPETSMSFNYPLSSFLASYAELLLHPSSLFLARG